MGTLGEATTPFAVLFHRLRDLLSVRILLYFMAPVLHVPKANVQEGPSELTFNALVSFLCPVRDFTCRYSASAVGPACASTLQLRWLKFQTRPTLTSVCHLILGHLCGYMSTLVEVELILLSSILKISSGRLCSKLKTTARGLALLVPCLQSQGVGLTES